jgi:chromosome segregation ATPase
MSEQPYDTFNVKAWMRRALEAEAKVKALEADTARLEGELVVSDRAIDATTEELDFWKEQLRQRNETLEAAEADTARLRAALRGVKSSAKSCWCDNSHDIRHGHQQKCDMALEALTPPAALTRPVEPYPPFQGTDVMDGDENRP